MGTRPLEFIDLRHLTVRDLQPLLVEEVQEWATELLWDFSPIGNLVIQHAGTKSLDGVGLLDPSIHPVRLAGYGYTVLEERRGLIGDLYLSRAARGEDDGLAETVRLFRRLLDDLIRKGARRVETQLILQSPEAAHAIQRARFVQLYERMLMAVDAEVPFPAGDKPDPQRFHIDHWGQHYLDPVSGVVEMCYRGHVDARMNEQYRSYAGSRTFLENLLNFPGCGQFCREASMVAIDRNTGWISGLVLASFVFQGVGHITQLCVAPHSQGTGLGYELLRRAAGALRAAGANRITLTVTSSNTAAVRLYERCGFSVMRKFFGVVWEPIL
jgi:ribosomal protein S18 acetylase RimI-like enzyme